MTSNSWGCGACTRPVIPPPLLLLLPTLWQISSDSKANTIPEEAHAYSFKLRQTLLLPSLPVGHAFVPVGGIPNGVPLLYSAATQEH